MYDLIVYNSKCFRVFATGGPVAGSGLHWSNFVGISSDGSYLNEQSFNMIDKIYRQTQSNDRLCAVSLTKTDKDLLVYSKDGVNIK